MKNKKELDPLGKEGIIKNHEIKNFMGIFPNAATKQYCEDVIQWFEFNNTVGVGGKKRTESRQESQPGMLKTYKDSQMYWLGLPKEGMMVNRDHPILKEFATMIWKAYEQFKIMYGAGLDQLAHHKISPSTKIQKYEPTQGYHVFHSDVSNQVNSIRVLVCALYLNTVEEGGETEFLYQKQRIAPFQGTLTLFPTTWTHLHRGNPPLKGSKYIMNTWLEFIE